MSESHKDRLFSQVPRSLPKHMDGPYVRRIAKKLKLSIEDARLYIEYHEEKKK